MVSLSLSHKTEEKRGKRSTFAPDMPQNAQMRVTTPLVLKASKLYDLLNYLHRYSKEGVHIPVGDISQTKGYKD